MITQEKYIIFNHFPKNKKINAKLCILNFDINNREDAVYEIIKNNADTVFWAVSNNYSKDFVMLASKLGIQNIVQFPIEAEQIDKFFRQKEKHSQTNYNNYPPLTNSNAIIIDDNPLNIELLDDILIDLGVKTTTCQNPITALNLLSKTKYCLILLDILMPEMSGFELAEKIKTDTQNKETPIIFISAISGADTMTNGYSLGACSYIEKPFSPKVVKAQLYNILCEEEKRHKNDKLKDNFVATLTHDLKSPINAEITALTHLIKRTGAQEENENFEILSELLNSAKYMKIITDKILCYYKQKYNDISLNKTETHMNEIIIYCINNVRFLAKEKNITLRFDNKTINSVIYSDEIEITRVINNLISNAIEYSKQNSYIDIRLYEDNKNLFFEIEDYGYGIDLTKHKQVFEEYMTLSKEHKKTGFGLGLWICKKIINAHNGDITIKSETNKGTLIKFKLPKQTLPNDLFD